MSDLWGVTAFFNPAKYQTKVDSIKRFARGVRIQGLRLLVVEMAFNEETYILADDIAEIIVRVRSNSVLWQKERLLNIGVKHLPVSCEKFAWLDADIAFGNDAWVDQTVRLLEKFKVVQLYDVAWWLPPNVFELPAGSTADKFQSIKHSFAFTQSRGDRLDLPPGHPGFAWAIRRELIDTHGLYDRFVVGGGDLAIASASYADVDCPQLRTWLSKFCTLAQTEDYVLWRNGFRAAVAEKVTFLTGNLFHWWHGKRCDRHSIERHLMLKDANFDPRHDIAIGTEGCWTWNSQKPDLHRQVCAYFQSRKEDAV